jgi:hypothetical protein
VPAKVWKLMYRKGFILFSIFGEKIREFRSS